ncbi:MAG: ATP-binding cassette domain-containing protein [Actinomycetota bacterium]|nr:ATP-binding cassette domain-containing protein [Actinomycetota bacterium]
MATIRLVDLGRTYGGTPPVVALAGITLTIRPGEFVSFVGPSGSGKSTLLNLIALLDRPSSGTYSIDDRDVGKLTERDRAALRSATFGFVFQSFYLLDRYSSVENVELGLLYRAVPPAKRRSLALEALERVGLAARADHPANKLSGGERQRVAIARATVGGAPVLVADEPTGNLDSANSKAIVDLLRRLNRNGTTIVLVTHDPEVAAVADRRISLRDGTITHEAGRAEIAAKIPASPSPTLAVSRVELRGFLKDAMKAFAARRGRAVALVAAVAVAVALVVATLGLSQTASAQVSERFDARRNREVAVRAAVGSRDDPGATPSSAGRALPPDAEQRARALAGVEEAGVLLDADQQLVAAVASRPPQDVSFIGISSGLLTTVGATVEWARGEDRRLGPREALVGAVTATALDLSTVANTPHVLVNQTPFAVVGVIRDVDRSPELLSAVVAGIHDAREIGRVAQVSLLMRTSSGAARQVADQVPLALDPIDPGRFEVDAPADPTSLRAEIEGDVRATMLALSGVAFLASMVGIANAMTMGVVERISEFGLRRALGARPRHVLAQVTTEALTTGMAGGAAGLYVGLLGVLAATVAKGWQPVLDLRLMPLALVSGGVVGVCGGLVAAVRASRIQPIDALRH